jgi:hypothetical protein
MSVRIPTVEQPKPRATAPFKEKSPSSVAFLDHDHVLTAFHEKKNTSGFDYGVFERLLPSQTVVATSADIVGLYSTVFFINLGIFGCTTRSSTIFESRRIIDILVTPINTFSAIPCRDYIPYALLWSKQPSEDTPVGWRKAIQEAITRGSDEYRKACYSAWLDKDWDHT